MTLDEIERQTILQALEQHKGNLSQVAIPRFHYRQK